MAKTRDEGGAVILQFPSVRREPSASRQWRGWRRLGPWLTASSLKPGSRPTMQPPGWRGSLLTSCVRWRRAKGPMAPSFDCVGLWTRTCCTRWIYVGSIRRRADRLISLEVQAARADRLTGTLQAALHAARANLRGRAIAARAAADAMEGAAKALVSYIRGVAESSVPDAAEPEQLLLFAAAG